MSSDEQIERFYRHGYLAECNNAMARMYGYASAEEIVGARFGDFLPSSVPENVEYLRSFVRSGYQLTDAESEEVDRHGNIKYFSNNLTGIIEDGALVRAWGTQLDVTERKRAEEAQRFLAETSTVLARLPRHAGQRGAFCGALPRRLVCRGGPQRRRLC